ncbi:hypothetical protein [Paraburkholderia sp.]|nr:hypothetical protein [Paraburkholderia sp.]MDE1181783.1 hypothetical protein [Paraburkholderia sp.]
MTATRTTVPHASPKTRKPLTLIQLLAIIGGSGLLASIVLQLVL